MLKLLFVDKPAGVTTHSSLNQKPTPESLIDTNDGFVEALSARSGRKLWVTHRLDRETTGTLLLAQSEEAAEQMREAFSKRTVKKRYLFLTDKKSNRSDHEVASYIERTSRGYTSELATSGKPANARTLFKLIDESHDLYLWEAEPLTGRTHQIRLHAASLGLPILGDSLYGGSIFPSLNLHSHELSVETEGGIVAHTSLPPRWFMKRELAKNPLLSRWLRSIDRRERLLRSWNALDDKAYALSTLRWLHTESDPLRADQLGSVVSFSWFADPPPAEEEMLAIKILCEELEWKDWYLQIRGNRGRSPNEESIVTSHEENFPQRWLAEENGLKFEFRIDTGLSAGLFLDQRQNRHWVQTNSHGKDILNLFSYTGGFSVAAASGQANRVVSVDLSRSFMEWTKTNFALNGLALEPHEFRAMDSREYLTWAAKKNLSFDLVICDPPSFSRSKAGVFRVEKDLESLLDLLAAVTKPNGTILFALNFEGWTLNDFATRLNAWSNRTRFGKLLRAPSADWDFELPGEERQMKSAFLVKTHS